MGDGRSSTGAWVGDISPLFVQGCILLPAGGLRVGVNRFDARTISLHTALNGALSAAVTSVEIYSHVVRRLY